MGVSITIRDVPDETRNVLASRAAASGRSLQEFLNRELQELAARPEMPDLLRTIRVRAQSYAEATSIVDDVAADRR